MSGRIYGKEVFSPKYIAIQIFTLTASFYAVYSTIAIVFGLLVNFSLPTVRQLFTDTAFNPFSSLVGLSNTLALLVSAGILSWFIKIVVERSRKVLDFVFTLHVFNFLLTWVVGGFPATAAWWVVHALALGVSTVGGETLCRREESAEIILASLERE